MAAEGNAAEGVVGAAGFTPGVSATVSAGAAATATPCGAGRGTPFAGSTFAGSTSPSGPTER